MNEKRQSMYVYAHVSVLTNPKTKQSVHVKEFQIASKIFSLTFTFNEISIPSLTMYSSGVVLKTVKSEDSKQIDFPEKRNYSL